MTATPSDPLPRRSNERTRRQFSLRVMFADVTLFAVVFALMGQAYSAPSNPLSLIAPLAGMAILGATIGTGLAAFLGRRKRSFGVLCAIAAALALSPIFIAMEWGRDHPWPTHDWLYVMLAILRCGMLGCVVGYPVAAFLDRVADRAGVVAPSRWNVRKLFAAVVLVAAMFLAWAPVTPWYQHQFAIGRLRTAIEAGATKEVGARALALRGSSDESGVVGMVLFRALNDSDAGVRIRALEALKVFGDAASETKPAVKRLLDDDHEGVRAAAAELLGMRDVNAGPETDQ